MTAAGKMIKLVAAMIATIAVAALSPPVFAQSHKGSGASGPPAPDETAKLKQRADEAKAAKAAMDRIPDSKEKYNPWKIER
jgi:hypothetical protein